MNYIAERKLLFSKKCMVCPRFASCLCRCQKNVFASMYPAYCWEHRFPALMESARALPHKAFSHRRLLF